MNDPQRLLISDGTALERELLRSVLDEPVPIALRARMAAALLLPGAAPVAELGSSSSLDGGSIYDGLSSKALTSTSQGALTSTTAATTGVVGVHLGKVLLATLSIGSVLTAGWAIKERAGSDVTAPSANVVAAPASDVASGPSLRAVGPPPEGNARSGSEAEDKPALAPSPEAPAQPSEATVGDVQNDRRASPRVTPVRDVKPIKTSTEAREANANTVAVETERASPRPTLSAELKLLDAARSAIQRGDAQHSLQVLDTYARQFPNGELAHEAKVLRQLAQRNQQQ